MAVSSSTSSTLARFRSRLPLQLALAGVATAVLFGSQFYSGAMGLTGSGTDAKVGTPTDAAVVAPIDTSGWSTGSMPFDGEISIREMVSTYGSEPVPEQEAVLSAEPIAEVGSAVQVTAPVVNQPVAQVAPPVVTTNTQAQAAAPAAPPAAAPAALAPVVSVADKWTARGVRLQGSESWDEVSLANVDAALSAIPARMLGSLGNPALGPINILVNPVGRTMSGAQPYGGPANFFSTNDGKNELVLYPKQSVFTIVHELGHAYNLRRTVAGRYNLVLLDAEMQSFMAAVGWKVTSTEAEIRAAVDHMGVRFINEGGFTWPRLSHDDPLEDFANSFANFYLDPAGLQSLSQGRYNWFAANVGR
jgi:hypothetical protein